MVVLGGGAVSYERGTPATCPEGLWGPGVHQMTNLPGHLWRDKWTALSGPLSDGVQPRRRLEGHP